MATHGNYQGYQGSAARHTPAGYHLGAHILDPRLLDLVELVPGLFEDKRVLDVGCNQGGVAVDIALHFKAASVHGIDLDASLIHHAKSHLSFKYSRLPPPSEPTNPPADTAFAHGATPKESSYNASYFPVSSVLQHGHVLYPPEHTPGFPRNVTFEVKDVVELLGLGAGEVVAPAGTEEMEIDSASPKQRRRSSGFARQQQSQPEEEYDVVLLLSVLKWIHVHHGDAILGSLFAALYRAMRPRGMVVIELQDWESYEKAAKKNPALREKVKALEVRTREDMLKGIVENGFEIVGEVEEKVDAKGKVRRRRMVVFGKV